MNTITFEQLPAAVAELHNKVDELLAAIHSQSESHQEKDDLLTLSQAADFLDLAKATLYGLTSNSKIPHLKKGKRLYFFRQELEAWIRSGRKKTVDEIRSEATLNIK